jgi:hypothetical protein
MALPIGFSICFSFHFGLRIGRDLTDDASRSSLGKLDEPTT